MTFKTERVVPKTGLMLVGWGGNNGTTVTGAIIANRVALESNADYKGSIEDLIKVVLERI